MMEEAKKVLIVEDEIVIALDLQASLEKFGYEVVAHVTRGEDVINVLDTKHPDLILMDIKLEGTLDGVQTAEMIRENYNIPVIFITSYSNSEIIARAKKVNPFGYIVKPFNDRELQTNIEIAIYKHETELKLKESEKKYRDLSESIQQIILECDISGVIKYINRPGLEFLGITSMEYENGVMLTEFISASSFENILERIKGHSLRETYSLTREHLLRNKFGKHYFIEEYLSPVYTSNGISGLRGILIDITSKRLKETLYTLYNRLILLFNKDTTDPIEVIDYLLNEFRKRFFYLEEIYFTGLNEKKGSFVHTKCDTNCAVKYDYSDYVITSKSPLHLRGKELIAFNRAQNIKEDCMHTASWAGFPLYYSENQSGAFAFRSSRNENALTGGDFENLVTFFDNINTLFERITYLKYIRQSEEKYKHLVNSINEGLIQLDLKGNVTFINKQVTKITGYTSEDFVGKNLFHSLQMSNESKVKLKEELFKRSMDIPSQYELTVSSKEGKQLHLIINGSGFKNSKGKVIGSIATIIDVTEKKEYLKLIKESEQKFKTIFAQAAVGVAIINSTTGQLLDVNKKYCEIFGYSKEQLQTMNFQEFTYPEDMDIDQHHMDLLRRGRIREFAIEKRHVTQDGKLVWINLTVSALWERWEEPTNHIAIVENITRRKLMEEAVINSEKEKDKILKAMPDSFLLINSLSSVLSVYLKGNTSFVSLPKNETIIGRDCSSALHDSFSKFINSNIVSCLHNKQIIIDEIQFKTTKKIAWFELRMVPVNDDIFLLIARDISELKKKTNDNKKFFNIIEQTKELILITDKKGKIEYINPMFSEVTGYQLSEVKGKKPSLFKSNKQSTDFFKELWQTIISGRAFTGEIINRKKNGELYIEQKIITPLINEAGEIINFISTGRDVTEDKKKEKKIVAYQQLKKNLEKRQQRYRTLSLIQGQENERNRLARELHDGLGQMLTVANVNLGNILLDKSGSSENKSRLKVVRDMLAEIIQESRRISHNLSPVGLYEFGLDAVVSQFVKRVNSNINTLKIDYHSNLGPTRFNIESEINLYRIFQETIQNSIKHAQCSTITINIDYTKNMFSMNIKDNGVGFNPVILKREGSLNGLRNIQERAKIIDAQLDFITAPDKGFELNINLKLKAK